jgi:hypothetical protein
MSTLKIGFTISIMVLCLKLSAQNNTNNYPKFYQESIYIPQIDSLRAKYGKRISYKNKKGIELGTLLAISHYPELHNRDIRIIIKNVRGAPVEASFSPFNFLKSKKSKIYKIIIHENSFMERLPLNKQVAALGHEMAHFIQYEEKGFAGTLVTLLGYVTSNKKRMAFEKNADKIGIDHGLGPHMLKFSFYTNNADIRSYMDKMGYPY